jgi:prepilin peptidase CpaA
MVLFNQLLVFLPVVLFLAAGIHDLLTMKVPNKICLALMLVFIPAAWMAGLTAQEALTHVGIAFAALLVGFVAFHFSWMGGGDGKLLAAGALWIGPSVLLEAFIAISFIGGAMAFAIAAAKNYLPAGVLPGVLGRAVDSRLIPYGAAIAGGVLLAFFYSPIPLRLVFHV